MNVGVVGSRTITDYDVIKSVLSNFNIECVISGGAVGVDSLAERYMEELELYGIIFNPDYDKHKKGAPLVRNRKIVEHSDIIVAVWDSKSKGTKYAIDYAKKQRKPTFIYNENGKLIEAYDGN